MLAGLDAALARVTATAAPEAAVAPPPPAEQWSTVNTTESAAEAAAAAAREQAAVATAAAAAAEIFAGPPPPPPPAAPPPPPPPPPKETPAYLLAEAAKLRASASVLEQAAEQQRELARRLGGEAGRDLLEQGNEQAAEASGLRAKAKELARLADMAAVASGGAAAAANLAPAYLDAVLRRDRDGRFRFAVAEDGRGVYMREVQPRGAYLRRAPGEVDLRGRNAQLEKELRRIA